MQMCSGCWSKRRKEGWASGGGASQSLPRSCSQPAELLLVPALPGPGESESTSYTLLQALLAFANLALVLLGSIPKLTIFSLQPECPWAVRGPAGCRCCCCCSAGAAARAGSTLLRGAGLLQLHVPAAATQYRGHPGCLRLAFPTCMTAAEACLLQGT